MLRQYEHSVRIWGDINRAFERAGIPENLHLYPGLCKLDSDEWKKVEEIFKKYPKIKSIELQIDRNGVLTRGIIADVCRLCKMLGITIFSFYSGPSQTRYNPHNGFSHLRMERELDENSREQKLLYKNAIERSGGLKLLAMHSLWGKNPNHPTPPAGEIPETLLDKVKAFADEQRTAEIQRHNRLYDTPAPSPSWLSKD
jgi:hypothetical protein